jgi:hypothetical protein
MTNLELINWDEDLFEETVFEEQTSAILTQEGQCTESKSKGDRYANITENDMDTFAQQRLSANTENKTKWAVNLLKGK